METKGKHGRTEGNIYTLRAKSSCLAIRPMDRHPVIVDYDIACTLVIITNRKEIKLVFYVYNQNNNSS